MCRMESARETYPTKNSINLEIWDSLATHPVRALEYVPILPHRRIAHLDLYHGWLTN
jgi:hypothetical protein